MSSRRILTSKTSLTFFFKPVITSANVVVELQAVVTSSPCLVGGLDDLVVKTGVSAQDHGFPSQNHFCSNSTDLTEFHEGKPAEYSLWCLVPTV